MNLICGINPVLEALEAGERHFDRLLVLKGLRNRRVSDAMSRASQLGIPLRFETRETLDRLSGGLPHQGVLAVVSAKPVLTLESLLDQTRAPALLVVLDGVEDPRNLGAILRTSEAAGADGVVLPDRHSAGLSETVSRASAGALEHVRVARIGNVAQALEALKARGIWVVGLDAAGGERWDAVDLRQPVALVLGGEGRGMRRLVREHCDHLVSLPMFGHVGSLNVAVAAGIALYEAVRQRGSVPSHVRPIPLRAAGPHVVGHSERADHWQRPAGRPSEPQEEEDAPNVLLHEEEEPWWGTAVGSAPVPRRPRRGERMPRERRAQPRGPAAAETRGPREANEGNGPRRRRRRGRRPRPQDAPGGPAPASEGAPPPEASVSTGEAGAPRPPARPRRRFRRKRR